MAASNPCKIGLTGGIGSGKSVVSQLLRLMGIPVYDCDTEAKRLMCQNEEIRAALIEAVGNGVYHADGQLNKTCLATYMFGDPERVARVNRIVHPIVRADFRQWAIRSGRETVAVESAILFEAGMDDDVDEVWAVYAPENIRLQRAVLRDASTEAAVRSRMQCQLNEQEYVARADKIIYNDARHSLIQQVSELLAR